MARLRSVHIAFLECDVLAGEADVVALVEALRPMGLALGNGAWTFDGHPSPADDIAEVLAERHSDWPQIWRAAKERPRDPLKHTETWASSLLRLDQPHTFATLGVTRRGW